MSLAGALPGGEDVVELLTLLRRLMSRASRSCRTDTGVLSGEASRQTNRAAPEGWKATTMVEAHERGHLRRCLELAAAAVDAGDKPFGSVLVGADGRVLHEDRNRAVTKDPTYHPEIALVWWAVANLSVEERSRTTVYTSGEHCAMCSAAHAWGGLGRIVFASSGKQLAAWFQDWGLPTSPLAPLSITDVAPGTPVEGPVDDLADQVRELHRRANGA